VHVSTDRRRAAAMVMLAYPRCGCDYRP
jgi:hypothetical protein